MSKKRLKKSFAAKNDRRCALIDKKFAGGLSSAETSELKELTAWVDIEMMRVHPVDFSWIDGMKQEILAAADRAAALKEKIEARLQEREKKDKK